MWITLFICVTIYLMFGPYFEARAKMLHEQARAKEIENDTREYGIHEDDITNH
jgi:hypothetical protein